MLKINNKGLTGAELIPIIWLGLAVSTTVFSLTVARGPHIEKRALQKCMTEWDSQEFCADMIDDQSQDERIEYIRDNEIWGNGGNMTAGEYTELSHQ